MVCGKLPFNDNSLHSLIVQTRGKLTFPPRTMCSLGKEIIDVYKKLLITVDKVSLVSSARETIGEYSQLFPRACIHVIGYLRSLRMFISHALRRSPARHDFKGEVSRLGACASYNVNHSLSLFGK